MFLEVQHRLEQALQAALRSRFQIEDQRVALQRTPEVTLGDLATPLPFELAGRLRRPPREIAADLIEALGAVEGVERAEPAGGGYINFFLSRAAYFEGVRRSAGRFPATSEKIAGKTIVEHTNINPNKAAHIGHLRNAVLGDTFVRLLRYAGHEVEVQNYIDNTGVQVADVIVGFEHLEKLGPAEVKARIESTDPPFDYYCWDLYARVTQFYEEDRERLALRARTLQAIETGAGETAQVAEWVATAIVRRHLATAARLGVQYDVLPRESEILHLKFWDAAFQKLKETGAIQYSESGKTQGCWVMRTDEAQGETDSLDDAKIIVRSDGTVTYVGKDIAYQLWKFGLLGKDFGYREFHQYADGHRVWMTSEEATDDAPAFGSAARVYNVIDTRQSYLQKVVTAGVRALGYEQQADASIHFSYEMVGLSPACARELGVETGSGETAGKVVEVSGRKGLGVKADDLLDSLEASALKEVEARHADLPEAERKDLAHKIAVAALRFFMLKYTRNTVIAFDFSEALSFEGETGPYLQYSAVRARNILRKAEERDPAHSAESLRGEIDAASLAGEGGDDFWELILSLSELRGLVGVAVREQEPASVAKWAFTLAQKFNLFYHKHHILSESDAGKRRFLLALVELFQRQLTLALSLLGIEVPERM